MINPAIQEKRNQLDSIGWIYYPVVPAQSADKYPKKKPNEQGVWQIVLDKEGNKVPKFNGKRPSFFDKRGIPQTISLSDHKDKPPSKELKDAWFQDSRTGIGAYCSDKEIGIDFDVKNFGSKEECTRRINAWLDEHSQLKNTWIEQTHSGGWRVIVKVKTEPTFTNFSLDGIGGRHHGEALGEDKFTVLAPSIGVSGNPYICINFAKPVEIESLESIGIYSVRKEVGKKQSREGSQNQSDFTFDFEQEKHSDEVSILHLICARVQALTQNSSPLDRSFAFTSITREFFGWHEWLKKRSISVIEDIKKQLSDVGVNIGLDSRRIEKIIASINPSDCVPGLFFTSNDLGCWEKIKKAHKDVFNKLCPGVIKEALEAPVKHVRMMSNGIEFTSNKYFSFEQLDNWFKFKKYTPTETQNASDIDLSKIPLDNTLIFIKAAMGVGKTKAALEVIKSMNNDKCFWMSSRVKLLLQTIARASLEGILMYLINEEDDLSKIENENLAFCGESIHKRDGHFPGKTLIIDEIGSELKQLLGGGTVKSSKQALALKVFRTGVKDAARVIVMDANLTDEICDLLSSFAPDKEVIKIENTYTRGFADIKIIQATKLMADGSIELCKKDKSPLVKLLLESKKETKLAIPCDSKRTCNTIEKLLFEHYKWGFNLNQETSEETWLELFQRCTEIKEHVIRLVVDVTKKWSDELLNDPNAFLLKYNPDFFVYSPTAESGVSITCQYFNLIVALFCGVLDTNAQTQMLFRVRDLDIPRYVFCPESGLKTETTYDTFSTTKDALEAALKLMSECCPSTQTIEEVVNRAMAKVDKQWGDYAVKIGVCDNFEKSYLRDCLIFQLKSMGHSVEVIEELRDDDINEQTKITSAILLEEEAEQIFNAEPFEDLRTAQEALKKSSNKKIRRRYEKTRIISLLPEIEKAPIWSDDFILKCFVKDRHYYSQQEKLWLLLNFEEGQKTNEFWRFINTSFEFITDGMLKDDRQVIVTGLKKLGIDILVKELEKGFVFTKNTPEIKEILERARKHKDLKKLKQFQPRKATIEGKEIIPFIRSLLSLVGVNLEHKERARDEEGTLHRWYGLDNEGHLDPYRLAVFEGIDREKKTWLETEYLKPDWDHLKNTDTLPEEFMNRNRNEEIEHRISFEESIGESKTTFPVSGVGEVTYTYPDKHILIIVRKYAKYLKGELNLEDINYSKEALDKAVQVLADIEIYPTVKETLAPLFA